MGPKEKGRYGARALVYMMLGLVFCYGVADTELFAHGSTAPGVSSLAEAFHIGSSSSEGNPAGGFMNSTTDVPDSVVSDIAAQVGTVGTVDELVVQGAPNSGGYDVSATIDLGDAPDTQSAWRTSVRVMTQGFFTKVFQTNRDVQNAAVYFMLDGRVIAGAGLGKQKYAEIASAASTGQGGFVQGLQALPVVTQGGPMDSWFEIQSPPVP